jgi:predicted nucleic acid-binding protein
MIIICDTDFLSSFLKIERLELVKDLFKEENLYTPIAVLGEIAKTDLITDLLNKEWIKVKKVSDEELKEMEKDKEFTNLGSGEKECLALCKRFKNSILLISDNEARRIANKRNILVLNISGFLLACKRMRILNRDDILAIIQDLKEKDYYEFSEEERNRLINSVSKE